MNPDQRVVTELPLPELWNERGPVPAARGAPLAEADVARLLTEAGATFAVAEVGRSLFWVPAADRFVFWKREAKGRVASPGAEAVRPEAFPGGYCYLASEWQLAAGGSVVVLERRH